MIEHIYGWNEIQLRPCIKFTDLKEILSILNIAHKATILCVYSIWLYTAASNLRALSHLREWIKTVICFLFSLTRFKARWQAIGFKKSLPLYKFLWCPRKSVQRLWSTFRFCSSHPIFFFKVKCSGLDYASHARELCTSPPFTRPKFWMLFDDRLHNLLKCFVETRLQLIL